MRSGSGPALAAGGGLAGLAWLVRPDGRLVDLDRQVNERITSADRRRTAPLARVVTGLGASPVAYPLLTIVLLGRPRRTRAGRSAGRPLLVAVTAHGVRRLLAEVVDRPRPPESGWLARASGPSFPSRHTATAALCAGLVAGDLCRDRRVVWTVAHGVGVSVAASRIWLGVHWMSDVVGGWLYAVGWLSAYGVVSDAPGR